MAERKARIEVGYGLEGALTDAIAARILRERLTPAFRDGRYADGVEATVAAIEQATQGEYEGGRDSGGGPPAIAIFLAILVVFFIVSTLTGGLFPALFGGQVLTGRGARRTGRGGWGSFGGGGWGGGWSGGGGGGGFSGGGGLSGGGGASGGW
jgi:uncharacterized protein